MIKIAIVDDDVHYIHQLEDYLDRYQKESSCEIQITTFTDGDQIVTNYQSNYDIIFMDIQMRFMNGLNAAKAIRSLDKVVIIIFITNMTQYAIKGYQVNALDYIVKPVAYLTLSIKLDRAIERIKSRDHQYLLVPINEGVHKLDILSIYYIESKSHSLIYYTSSGQVISRGTMKNLENVICQYGFFRSNSGYIVNMKYVAGVVNNCCLIKGEQLPISRSKKKEFMKVLSDHVSEVMY